MHAHVKQTPLCHTPGRYSVLSNVASSGLNLVATMLPAKDAAEFAMLPARDRAFVKRWVQFTDQELPTLLHAAPIPTLDGPKHTREDGTSKDAAVRGRSRPALSGARSVPWQWGFGWCFVAAQKVALPPFASRVVGGPRWGGVDGWHASNGSHGFVFLFNPGWPAVNVTLPLDEAIGLSRDAPVEELYPCEHCAFDNWKFGHNTTIEVSP